MASDTIPIFDRVDQHVDSIEFQGQDIDSLAMAVAHTFESDFEKIRAVYKYVINYIAYDDEAYKNGKRRINQANADIIRRGKAVCWGYAQLITEMCSMLDLPCFTVTGYAKDSPVPPRSFEKANHAWNAVKLAGDWYLLDATWGRAVQSGDNYFSRTFGLNYFLSDPVKFAQSHHPLMPMWQLLSCPISYAEFISNRDSKINADYGYNFQDSIDVYTQLSYLDQQLKIMQVAYAINNTTTNRSQVGHALVDIAIQKKEHGDLLMEQDSQALAIEELDASLHLFTLAKRACTFYPWQEEAHIYSAINLAQVTYGLFSQDANNSRVIIDRFKIAKKLIEESRLQPSLLEKARLLIDGYLDVLEAY